MYKEKIKAIDKKTSVLSFEREEIMMEWVKKCHPVKVGDRIAPNLHYYLKQEYMDVYYVDIRETTKGFYFVAYGYIVEGNGKTGTISGEWRQEC